MTATADADGDQLEPIAHAVPRLLRARHGHRHHRHRRRAAGDRLARRQPLYAIAAVAYVVLGGARSPGGSPSSPSGSPPTSPATPRASRSSPSSPATNVLGSASAIIHGWWTLAWVLWWCQPRRSGCSFVYTTLIAVVLRHDKPGLGAGINGTWFLLTVSTESVAVLGALLLGHAPQRLPRLHAASPRSASASCST